MELKELTNVLKQITHNNQERIEGVTVTFCLYTEILQTMPNCHLLIKD